MAGRGIVTETNLIGELVIGELAVGEYYIGEYTLHLFSNEFVKKIKVLR